MNKFGRKVAALKKAEKKTTKKNNNRQFGNSNKAKICSKKIKCDFR